MLLEIFLQLLCVAMNKAYSNKGILFEKKNVDLGSWQDGFPSTVGNVR